LRSFKEDALVKSRKTPFPVIPAEAGIQSFQVIANHLDSGFHRSDDFQVTYTSKGKEAVLTSVISRSETTRNLRFLTFVRNDKLLQVTFHYNAARGHSGAFYEFIK